MKWQKVEGLSLIEWIQNLKCLISQFLFLGMTTTYT